MSIDYLKLKPLDLLWTTGSYLYPTAMFQNPWVVQIQINQPYLPYILHLLLHLRGFQIIFLIKFFHNF